MRDDEDQPGDLERAVRIEWGNRVGDGAGDGGEPDIDSGRIPVDELFGAGVDVWEHSGDRDRAVQCVVCGGIEVVGSDGRWGDTGDGRVVRESVGFGSDAVDDHQFCGLLWRI